MSIDTADVTVSVAGGEMSAYRAKPTGDGPFPMVLVVQDVSKVPDSQVMADLDVTVCYAKSTTEADTSRLGITGFCWGGRIAWMYAGHNPAVKAAVPCYGPVARAYHEGDPTALDVVPRIAAAVLGLHGGDDPGIPNDTTASGKPGRGKRGRTTFFAVVSSLCHGQHGRRGQRAGAASARSKCASAG